jgi:hypothetical protein
MTKSDSKILEEERIQNPELLKTARTREKLNIIYGFPEKSLNNKEISVRNEAPY